MNFKYLFAVLLGLTAVYAADEEYKGECKGLKEKIESKITEGMSIDFYDCVLDEKEKAVNYKISIDCNYDFPLTQPLIDEISNFTNLNKLTLNLCGPSKEVQNFEPLKKLDKVTEMVFLATTHYELLDIFKNLKTVEMVTKAPSTIINNSIEELTLTEVDYDGIKVNLEGVTNVKKLKISTSPSDAGDLDIRFPKTINSLELALFNPTKDLIKKISELKNLEYLNIRFNEFNEKTDDLSPFQKLTKLTELYLDTWISGNKIIIPDIIFSLKNLKTLWLNKVGNTEILDNVVNLKSLEKLTLWECGLTSIDKIIKLKDLKYLNLFRNEFTSLSGIENLKNLEYLDLRYGKFKTLPETITKLTNLESLDLSYSEMTEIPEFLNQLPKLKFINFSNCKNLKGKTLTNDSLEECYYNNNKKGNICKTKEMKCFSEREEEDEKIPLCNVISNEISTNGKCGPYDGHCSTGECCSKYGYCGTSEKHCGTGCQSEFGQCTSTTSVKISTNGKCGPEDGKCPDSKCCSKYGYCGTSDKHCGTGCQSEFGQCTSTTNVKISTNDKCGPEDGKCPDSKCCSKYGYCGTSDKHCGTGCQSEFGQCTSTTSVKISTNGKCGPEDGKCPDSKCCSKYGYCGTSDKHCKSGCQSQYGKCL